MVLPKSSKFNLFLRYLTMLLSTFPISDSSDSDKQLNQNSSMPAKLKNCPSKKCHCIGTFLWSQSIKNLKYNGQERESFKNKWFFDLCKSTTTKSTQQTGTTTPFSIFRQIYIFNNRREEKWEKFC